LPLQGKGNLLTKTALRVLTVIRGSEILKLPRLRKGLPERRFGGLFLLPVMILVDEGSELSADN
jgi:hypothetical protein